MIHELEALLPGSPNINFRERLVAHLEYLERLKTSAGQEKTDLDLWRLKAGALLIFYEKYFGVKDLVDKPDEE